MCCCTMGSTYATIKLQILVFAPPSTKKKVTYSIFETKLFQLQQLNTTCVQYFEYGCQQCNSYKHAIHASPAITVHGRHIGPLGYSGSALSQPQFLLFVSQRAFLLLQQQEMHVHVSQVCRHFHQHK
jgi:hypothetical protein